MRAWLTPLFVTVVPLFYGGFWGATVVLWSGLNVPANCLFAGFILTKIYVSRETMSEFIVFGRCIGRLKPIFFDASAFFMCSLIRSPVVWLDTA